jgi:hypothetical protein
MKKDCICLGGIRTINLNLADFFFFLSLIRIYISVESNTVNTPRDGLTLEGHMHGRYISPTLFTGQLKFLDYRRYFILLGNHCRD